MAKEKIVVIDDSPIVRKLAELALEEEGYKVYTAEDGEEGLRICEEVRPSVILVDFIMPRISGYQFCEAARDNELLKDIPIILITGKGEDVGKKFAEKFGVVDYFIKPFKSEILVEKVNAIIYAQKMQTGEEAGDLKIAALESSEMPGLPEHQEASFYGTPGISPEPSALVEQMYSASDMGYDETASEKFGLKEEELATASHKAAASLQKEPIVHPAEPVEMPEEQVITLEEPIMLAEEPVVKTEEPVVELGDTFAPVKEDALKPVGPFAGHEEIFARTADKFGLHEESHIKHEEAAELSTFAFPQSNEMLLQAGDESDVELITPVTSPYDFETDKTFASAAAFGGATASKAEYQPDMAVAGEGQLDSIFRRYLENELPYLIEKNMEDILRRYGIIKDTSILLSGDLGSVPAIEALKMAASRKLTGKFSAYSHSGSAEVYFEKGSVVYALSSRQGSTLTSRRVAIIKKGAQAETAGKTMEGIVDAVLTAVELKEGGFFFEKMTPPKALLDLGLRNNVMTLVLQAMRNKAGEADEGSTLTVSSVPVRAISDGAARNIGMNPQEIDVFLSVDGTGSIADIGGSSELGIVEVTRILSRLEKAGIVSERGVG
jgi:CheY-like chemotaxis protein